MATDDDGVAVSVWMPAITTTFSVYSFGSCAARFVKMTLGMMSYGLVVAFCLCLSSFSAVTDAQRMAHAPTTNHVIMNTIPKELLTGAYTLVDLNVNSLKTQQDDGKAYSAQATFCRVDWTVHQENPSLVSFFDDLRNHSCSQEVEVDLLDFVTAARRLDAATATAATAAAATSPAVAFVPRVGYSSAAAAAAAASTSGATTVATVAAAAKNIRPTGIIFHESRCGSTLAANMLAAFDPPSTRVYSEHFPAIDALRACAGQDESTCPSDTHQQLIQDVFFTLGRVPADSPVEKIFFKTNSGGMFISHFTRAFPETPWIYMYRDSQEIMQSHFKISEREINDIQHNNNNNETTMTTFDVPCARNQKKEIQPPATLQVLHRHNVTDVATLTMTEYCAVHLAGITHSVLTEHFKQQASHNKAFGIKTSTTTMTPKGRFVNYKQMPAIMYESIVPHHFDIALTDEMVKRMQAVTNMYSKGGKRKSSDVNAMWTNTPADSTPLPAPTTTSFLQGGQHQHQQQPSPQGATTRPAVPVEIVAAVARYCPDTYAQLEALRIRQEQEAETNLILLRKRQEQERWTSEDTEEDADEKNKANRSATMGWVELLTFTVQVFFCFEYLKKETLYAFVATKWHCMRLKAVSYWL
jgi:hypothetical protein